MNFNKKTKKGFTFIELMVVIAIIGVLSAVVLASVNGARTKSRDARRFSDVKQIQLALENNFDNNSIFPPDISASSLGNILPVVPKDPLTNAPYFYAVSSPTANQYCVAAQLEGVANSAVTGPNAACALWTTGNPGPPGQNKYVVAGP